MQKSVGQVAWRQNFNKFCSIYLSFGTESINFDNYLRWVGGWLNLEFSIKKIWVDQ